MRGVNRRLLDRLEALEALASARFEVVPEIPPDVAERMLKLFTQHEGEPGWDARHGPQNAAQAVFVELLDGRASA